MPECHVDTLMHIRPTDLAFRYHVDTLTHIGPTNLAFRYWQLRYLNFILNANIIIITGTIYKAPYAWAIPKTRALNIIMQYNLVLLTLLLYA